jgi:UDP-glucose 4-epimerase
VTGGTGFIGAHLVNSLAQQGVEVGVQTTRRHPDESSEYALFSADLRSPDMQKILADFRPDTVFHMAGRKGTNCTREYGLCVDVNVAGTANLLGACQDSGVNKIVFASSGGTVYGEPDVLPCLETNPLRPKSIYGATKVAGEALVNAFSSSFGLSGTSLRLPNVYGPIPASTEPIDLITVFGTQMIQNQQVTIFGSGDQKRDYLHVSDAVEAFLLAAEEDESHIYNVGTGSAVSVKSIFELMSDLIGYDQLPNFEPELTGDVSEITLDSGKISQRLGWAPTVELEAGLQSTIDRLRTSPN